MKNIWTILCNKSIIDEQSKNITMIDCVDQINVTLKKKKVEQAHKEGMEFIMIKHNLELVTLWYDNDMSVDREFEMKVNIINSEKKEIGSFSGNVSIPTSKKRVRNRLMFNLLPVAKTDEYTFVVFYKEKGKDKFLKAAEMPVEINVVIE